MTTLLAMCIAALFGGWIWTLKQDVRAMRNRLIDAETLVPETKPAAERRVADRDRVRNHVSQSNQVPVFITANGVRVQRELNGTQTFVIDG
jgi:hypothetical protein